MVHYNGLVSQLIAQRRVWCRPRASGCLADHVPGLLDWNEANPTQAAGYLTAFRSSETSCVATGRPWLVVTMMRSASGRVVVWANRVRSRLTCV